MANNVKQTLTANWHDEVPVYTGNCQLRQTWKPNSPSCYEHLCIVVTPFEQELCSCKMSLTFSPCFYFQVFLTVLQKTQIQEWWGAVVQSECQTQGNDMCAMQYNLTTFVNSCGVLCPHFVSDCYCRDWGVLMASGYINQNMVLTALR